MSELVSSKYEGELEINHEKGVIYFHSKDGSTLLRICCLPHPIPEIQQGDLLDITHGYGTSWDNRGNTVKFLLNVKRCHDLFYNVQQKLPHKPE